MIPTSKGLLNQPIQVRQEPSLTYQMQLESNRIQGNIDGLEAIRQMIYCTCNTERYYWVIYSWNYGIELMDLYGKRMDYCSVELERRIKEALFQDDRVLDVHSFSFTKLSQDSLKVEFQVDSTEGSLFIEKEFNLHVRALNV